MSTSPVPPPDRPGPGSGLNAPNGARSGSKAAVSADAPGTKSRRVRTGCLTCRERHLKCDEKLPICQNCCKSGRTCKRGLRLNFIDIQVKNPPMAPPSREWSVQFHDESRLIASEYKGGLGRYPRAGQYTPPRESDLLGLAAPSQRDSELLGLNPPNQRGWGQRRAGVDAFLPGLARPSRLVIREDAFRRSLPGIPSPYFPQSSTMTSQGVADGLMTPPNERTTGEREYLSAEDEIYFMQVFTEEVAIWMDVMDKDKQFSRLLPYLALKSPMVLNAMLACGAKQSALVLDGHNEEKAHYYYDTATKELLMTLKNPDRNTAECATTAVILNVYEIMSEKPNERMSHIAGARALIRESGWDATSPGLSGACFWVNIGMEVLSCLAFNWQTAWDPDQWGLSLDFGKWTPTPRTDEILLDDDDDNASGGVPVTRDTEGDEETWVHRIFYIVAKIANFRANIPRFQEASPHDEQVRRQTRYNEWHRLKGLCDAWNRNCPRSMQPYGYCHTASSSSLFPRVWLIKRPAIMGRLFYHTAMCMLAQINPMESKDSEDNRVSQLLHAHHTCGILAHTNDRAIASGALRCLAIAGAVLTERPEQEEVLALLEKTSKETGWRLGRVVGELKESWGWEKASAPRGSISTGSAPGPPLSFFASQPEEHHTARASTSTPATSIAAPTPMKPTVNPLLANADFAKQNHPYKNWYEPPNRQSTNSRTAWPIS